MNKYWVLGSGDWNDTAHWSTSSGGLGGSDVPILTDDVIIDSASGLSGGTITLGIDDSYCHDFTSTSGINYTIQRINGGWGLRIYGSVVFEAGITLINESGPNGGVNFYATDTGHTIRNNGVILEGNVNFFGSGGGWTLLDDMVITCIDPTMRQGFLNIDNGTFDANDHNITCDNVLISYDNDNPITIYMGSGTWECTGNYDNWYPWYCDDEANITIYCETSTIKFTDNTDVDKDFIGGNKTYYNLWFTGLGTGDYYLYDDNTFNELKIDAGKTVYFENGGIQTTTTLTSNGSSINNILFRSDSGGDQYTISATNPTVSFVDVEDCIADGGIPFMDWYGKDSGNNTNWKFPFNGGSGQGATSKPQLKSVESKSPKFG